MGVLDEIVGTVAVFVTQQGGGGEVSNVHLI